MYRCMDDSSTLVDDATNKFILLIFFFVCVDVAIVSCRVVSVSCRSKRKTEIRRNESVPSYESTLVRTRHEARVNSTLVCASPISLSFYILRGG